MSNEIYRKDLRVGQVYEYQTHATLVGNVNVRNGLRPAGKQTVRVAITHINAPGYGLGVDGKEHIIKSTHSFRTIEGGSDAHFQPFDHQALPWTLVGTVDVTETVYNVRVTGNTYPIKDRLKQLGGKYSNRTWDLPPSADLSWLPRDVKATPYKKQTVDWSTLKPIEQLQPA